MLPWKPVRGGVCVYGEGGGGEGGGGFQEMIYDEVQEMMPAVSVVRY